MTTATVYSAPTTNKNPLSAAGVVRSEWIKLRTIRSTLWCYGLLVLLVVGIGTLIAVLTDFGGGSITGEAAGSIVVSITTAGLNVAVLIVAVLGALIITGEYATGMIRSTFAAVPLRTGALAAKAIVLAVSTFVATSVGIWLTALVTWPILSGKGVEVPLGDPAVFMPMLGGAVYVTMIALLAFGFGTILRSTAGALATVLGLIMVAPIILQLLGGLTHADWVNTVSALLPQNAGSELYTFDGQGSGIPAPVTSDGLDLNGWGGFGVLAAWDAVVLGFALILVKRRDA
ncbi:ABC transporter permease subunit [Rathayibacter sp. YIM 133350]|uniref:ABC transporter permease subunit n=1 Tax=Rathayibacter sp. YIM 133350 TaxID=3131992 RepID=UPI00307F945C